MNLVRTLKTQLLGVTAGIGLLGVPAAHADLINGLVDVWNVSVSAEFLCATADFTGASGTSCASQAMSWGDNDINDRSGLTISNLPPAQVITNGPLVANTSVTHINRPISGNSLESVQLRSTLTLTPVSPAGAQFGPVSLDFLIDFLETDNGANPCANGGANGSGVNINGCADIFALNQTALNFPFVFDLDGDGDLPAHTYYISFFELTNGLNPLSNAACTAVGIGPGCYGFLTPEERSTTFQFAALITSEPFEPNDPPQVPVPGTVLLLGLGLAGLGWRSRRAQ